MTTSKEVVSYLVFSFFHFLNLFHLIESLLLKCWVFLFWSLGVWWLSAFGGIMCLWDFECWMVVLGHSLVRILEKLVFDQTLVTNKQAIQVSYYRSFSAVSSAGAVVLSLKRFLGFVLWCLAVCACSNGWCCLFERYLSTAMCLLSFQRHTDIDSSLTGSWKRYRCPDLLFYFQLCDAF